MYNNLKACTNIPVVSRPVQKVSFTLLFQFIEMLTLQHLQFKYNLYRCFMYYLDVVLF